ncbi:sulfatase-like hydrolase/transferase [Ruficoccus amylovorans]|uniref:Sulfatase-like hydrolase/transferase n=1 Tax=Ruficoccus amylovorans TaxID=1804625 RepID=A0A842HCU3_9BACT|nr:sulfatase-like hydrolase/transferase [Ruficoccus amylovorans]MBC2593888.1 sulfatase-like hydrolase/transferase [Ruficoccus amylovorans]
MKAIIVMFDSLNRHMLQPYGCDWVKTPNFQRLAERTVTFDNSYVCSMPCMPARRDLHTARPNFLHRGWGPLEPYDDSVFEMLKAEGVHSHLVTDHYHYWETGGSNYHTKYNTFEFIRGQEGDPWQAQVANPPPPENAVGQNATNDAWHAQDLKNRAVMRDDAEFCQSKTFKAGKQFIRDNLKADNWLLQIETFDPHEPFFCPEKYKSLYREHYDNYDGPVFDWPPYRPVTETREAVEHAVFENASLISMCDQKLGDILDLMDDENLWEDTMLIVWTDHGFCLGEHESWGKCWMPFYQEIAHTPFFIWDPRSQVAGERRKALVQPAIDIGPTLLNYFGHMPTQDMLGQDLVPCIENDTSVRETAIFGIYGGQVNITDGRYVYMRAATPLNQPLNQYTLTPAHAATLFTPKELQAGMTLHAPFSFTKNCPVLKIPAASGIRATATGVRKVLQESCLYDIKEDPAQKTPIASDEIENRFLSAIKEHLQENDAPKEQYTRLELP